MEIMEKLWIEKAKNQSITKHQNHQKQRLHQQRWGVNQQRC
jgi:hypothetical protein